MKKTLSVFLAALMLVFCMAPAYASDVEVYEKDISPVTLSGSHTVAFIAPSAAFEGGYVFAKTVDGVTQYVEDDNGIYVFYDNRFMTMDNIFTQYQPENPQYYSPEAMPASSEYEDGTVISFRIVTSPAFNAATAQVFVNGTPITCNVNGEYSVVIDRDLTIKVGEYDELGNPALLPSHFTVTMTSGDGYKVRTLKNENYNVVYYGGSFSFRVVVDSNYSASGITVGIARGANELAEYLGDDFDIVGNLLGKNDILSSYGLDEDGNRLYKIDNITTDCKIIVSGVRKSDTSSLLNILKRILRLILDFLGIKSDKINGLVAYYNVDIKNADNDITYAVVQGSEKTQGVTKMNVTSGDGISLIVSTTDATKTVNVFWTPGNEYGTYQTQWFAEYNEITGETVYSAIYNIDSIKADTVITIVS